MYAKSCITNSISAERFYLKANTNISSFRKMEQTRLELSALTLQCPLCHSWDIRYNVIRTCHQRTHGGCYWVKCKYFNTRCCVVCQTSVPYSTLSSNNMFKSRLCQPCEWRKICHEFVWTQWLRVQDVY